MKILVVEDDTGIRSVLQRAFESEGYRVQSTGDGDEGLYMAQVYRYDLIVLDWMLPGQSGARIASVLRQERNSTPILMLTARSELPDRLKGFECGVDDYLSKPFALEELMARVRALHRRSVSQGIDEILLGDIHVDLSAGRVRKGNETISLRPKERQLLELLIRHRGYPVSMETIEEHLWSEAEYADANLISVTVYNLRRKIGKEKIRTRRGVGFVLSV